MNKKPKTISIPPSLHEVFGQTQYPFDILLILFSALSVNILLFFSQTSSPISFFSWRAIVAHLLIFDIAAGAVANLTRSTNDHYQARASRRYVFYAVHIHLLLLFFLLDQSLPKAAIITALTLAASLLVNAMNGHPSQRILAASLVVLGCSALYLFLPLPPFVLVPSLLFVVKLTFSFSVDHNATQPN